MCDETAKRLTELEQRIVSMESSLTQIRHDTSDMIEMFRALSGGFKVLTWLGKLAEPIGYIAAAIAAIAGAWAALRGGLSK